MDNKAKKYCIKSGYILRQIAKEYVIVPVNDENSITNALMIPNDTAAFIWIAFQQPHTIEDIVAKILDEYDGTPEQIRRDVEQFVIESLNLKIIEEVV